MENTNPTKVEKILRSIVLTVSALGLVSIIVALIVVNGRIIQNSSIVVNAEGEAIFVDNEILKEQQAEEEARLLEEKRIQEEIEIAKTTVLNEAEILALSYDYDGAIEVLKAYETYEEDTRFTDKIAEYEKIKASCVPVNIKEVTHIFYLYLVVDPERAFANQEKNPQAVGNNQWMTTICEFQ